MISHVEIIKTNWPTLGYRETYVRFVIPTHTSTNAEMLVNIGPVVGEIFGEIGRLFAVLF